MQSVWLMSCLHRRCIWPRQRYGTRNFVAGWSVTSRHDITGRVAVIDCVTLWCTNYFVEQPEVSLALEALKREFDRFTAQDATFIFVTNEIGMGGVSPNEVQRRFTDLQGWMNQYIASKADQVVLMVCGIPVKVKG